MCLNQKLYFSPSKLVSPWHRERVFHPCKCGECAECKEQRRREWNFRLYHEFQDCISKGGYVIMDMLSYSDDNLPHLSDFVGDDIDFDAYPDLDFPCFSRPDIQLYMKRLRERLPVTVRSFVASEYGTDEKYYDSFGRVRQGTHRPHYHQLLFVQDGSISPLKVFNAVNQSWQKGLTQINDRRGVRFVLQKYVIKNVSLGAAYYVSKYVVKDSPFQVNIDKRLAMLSHLLNQSSRFYKAFNAKDKSLELRESVDVDYLQSVSKSVDNKRLFRKLRGLILQRVYPSVKFGASFLDCCNVDDLIESNTVSMPDKFRLSISMPLPMYYRRKLFYEVVKYLGCKSWQLNDLGRKAAMFAHAREYTRTFDKYASLKYGYNFTLNFDVVGLTNYICNKRGRVFTMPSPIAADLSISDKLKLPDLFVLHTSDDDVVKYGERYVSLSRHYLDDPPEHLAEVLTVPQWVSRYVYFDDFYEKLILKLSSFVSEAALSKQRSYDLRVHLQDLRKHFIGGTIFKESLA